MIQSSKKMFQKEDREEGNLKRESHEGKNFEIADVSRSPSKKRKLQNDILGDILDELALEVSDVSEWESVLNRWNPEKENILFDDKIIETASFC